MNYLYYIEINVICVFILAILIFIARWGSYSHTEDKNFGKLCFCAIIIFALDILWTSVNGATFKGARALNQLFTAAYFIQIAVFSYAWVRFSLSMHEATLNISNKQKLLCAAPALTLIIATISSLFFPAVFFIDKFNIYQRGPLHSLQLIMFFIYIVALVIFCIYQILKSDEFITNDKLITFTAVGFIPLIGLFLQILFPESAFFCIFITFSLVFAFTENLSHLISIDELSRLQNKNLFYPYLNSKIQMLTEDKNLFLFIGQINSLGKINRSLGIPEGDKCLLYITSILKDVFEAKGHYIARISNKQFVVVAELLKKGDALLLRSEFENLLKNENKISFTMGIAEKKPGDTSTALLERAERDLQKKLKEGKR